MQAEQHQHLKAALKNVAGGLMRLGEVCGILPDTAKLPEISQDIEDILDAELSGRTIKHRIDTSWAIMSQGNYRNIIDMQNQHVEQVARRLLVQEVGDLDLRVRKECVMLVTNRGKEGREKPLPAVDGRKSEPFNAKSRAAEDKGQETRLSFRAHNSDMGSTTCSTAQACHSPFGEWRDARYNFPRSEAGPQRPTQGRPRTSPTSPTNPGLVASNRSDTEF